MRVETATLLQRIKVPGALVVIAGTVAVLAHGAVAAPRLWSRPPGSHQELRKAPTEPAPSPESTRKRAVRSRPVSA